MTAPVQLFGCLADRAAELTKSQRKELVLGGLSRAVTDVLTVEYQPLSARFGTSVFGVKKLMDVLERANGNCTARHYETS